MQEGTIGRRYARALAESLGAGKADKATLAKVEQELSALGGLLSDKRSDFRQAMLNPSFGAKERQAILDSIADQNDFHPITRIFLRMLVEKDRLPYLNQIAIAFRSEVDERIGQVRATIISAKPLDGDAVGAIVKALEKRTDKKVLPETVVKPEVLSGVAAKIGGLVFDGTLKAQLDKLRAELR